MLKLLAENSYIPTRVVILGSNGFVANATHQLLKEKGIGVLAVPRESIDLTENEAGKELAKILLPTDTVLFVSAKAPVKNNSMLIENIRMAEAVCEAVQLVSNQHLIYISSDAVYADSMGLLNESSPAEPSSLHGVMHLAREVMLLNSFNGALCFLRPTLIYGLGDPHNGYGPNRFLRLAKKSEDIVLFGEGEELRDHVHIQDVAQIILLSILHKCSGKLNIVSGKTISFKEIALEIVNQTTSKSKILSTKRVGNMPHNGYRAFDNSNTLRAFPNFKYKSFTEGLSLMKGEKR